MTDGLLFACENGHVIVRPKGAGLAKPGAKGKAQLFTSAPGSVVVLSIVSPEGASYAAQ